LFHTQASTRAICLESGVDTYRTPPPIQRTSIVPWPPVGAGCATYVDACCAAYVDACRPAYVGACCSVEVRSAAPRAMPLETARPLDAAATLPANRLRRPIRRAANSRNTRSIDLCTAHSVLQRAPPRRDRHPTPRRSRHVANSAVAPGPVCARCATPLGGLDRTALGAPLRQTGPD
jgi:hypothetical protein